jgi:predicted ArsR family transcriptional regulator
MPNTTTPYRQEQILNWLYDHADASHTTRQIAEGVGVTHHAARSALYRLREKDQVRFMVKRPRDGRWWRLNDMTWFYIRKARQEAVA